VQTVQSERFIQQPNTRINYYVCGSGGLGKGLMSKAIARSLFPHLLDDDDIFFPVGSNNATFEGYDGQPVIIWNDCRAIDLLQKLGGRGNVFDVFDTHPSSTGRQNVKYSSVKLCNTVNIVNSVEDYSSFLNGLAGEYTARDGAKIIAEDKGQSYRRFPMIIPLHQEDFDLLLNKGFLEDTNDFSEYISYKNIRGNLQKIAVMCSGNEKLAREIESRTIKTITDKHQEVLEKINNQNLDDDEIRKMFERNGKTWLNLEKEEKPVYVENEKKEIDLLEYAQQQKDNDDLIKEMGFDDSIIEQNFF